MKAKSLINAFQIRLRIINEYQQNLKKRLKKEKVERKFKKEERIIK